MAQCSESDWVTPSRSWRTVESVQKENDRISEQVYSWPINEIRAVSYRPPPLPQNVPQPDKHIEMWTVDIAARDGAQVPLRFYRSKIVSGPLPLFFNIHGGGWVMGQPETEEAQNRFIAYKNNALVISVDYRKAPEHPYPVPLNDCYDAFQQCRENAVAWNLDPDKIIIGGGSAGANLAAAVVLCSLRDRVPGILGQMLNIPVTCHPHHFPADKYAYNSYEQNAMSAIVPSWKMRWFWTHYLAGADVDHVAADPIISPLLAGEEELKDFPPTLIQVAGMDPLRDEGLAYVQALRMAGVPVKDRIYPGLPHAFYVYPDLPESTEYFQTMVEWVDGILKDHDRGG